MQAPLDNLARQLQREIQAKDTAIQMLTNRTRVANERAYGSSSVVGQSAIRTYLPLINDLITKRLFVLRRGKASVDAATVFRHLKDASDERTLGLIGLKKALDVLGKTKDPGFQELCVPIGAAICAQMRLDYYHKEDPELYEKASQWFHKATGTRQKLTVIKRSFNSEACAVPQFSEWDSLTKHKVGAWILDCIITVTGWVQKVSITRGKRSHTVMRYAPAYLEMRDTIIHQAEAMSFCQWPMLCPPVAWANDQRGGYLTSSYREMYSLVRKSGLSGDVQQGQTPIDMLNNAQSVAWAVNPRVLAVSEHCYEQRITIQKFRCQAWQQPPEPLDGEPTEDELKAWKRKSRQIHDDNAQISQNNWLTSETMYIARMYKDETFWIPWSFGYRGRLYPLVTGLNPQGTDHHKSLFYFAEEGPVNEFWIAFACSNTFGNDKLSMEARIQWTYDNQDLIKQVGTDPIGTIPLWEGVSEPWAFLAACCEWVDCVLGDKKTSGLPIGIDATQSGIQHLSALCRDHASGELVNLIPNDQPQDGYRTVAEHAAKRLPNPLNTWMNRKVTKRVCMCTPYGIRKHSARDYIREALKADKRDLKEPGVLSSIVNVVFEESIPEIFPGPVKAMEWLQQCASEIMQRQNQIQWVSPSGFVVVQDLRKPKGHLIKTRLLGSAVQSVVACGYAEPDVPHHRNALAPNVTHSHDAALIHLTFAHWDQPFSVIHDCVLGRGCDLDQMSIEIRHHFVEMYKEPVLQNWADQVGVTIPEGLVKNTLDITQVNDSKYFFC